MTIKQYLSRLRGLNRNIDALLEERKRLWALATAVSAPLTGMPHGGGDGDKIGRAVERLTALEGKINAEIDAYADMREEIDSLIRSLPDARHRAVLHYRYLDGLTWEQIAQHTSYDVRWVQRLHGYALTEAQKAIESHV